MAGGAPLDSQPLVPGVGEQGAVAPCGEETRQSKRRSDSGLAGKAKVMHEGAKPLAVEFGRTSIADEGVCIEVRDGEEGRASRELHLKAGTSDKVKGTRVKNKGDGILLELMGGSCRVTAEAEKAGCNALGVDWTRNRSVPEGRCITLDLTQEHGKDLSRRLFDTKSCRAVIMEPPCGTASRAREKVRAVKRGRSSKDEPVPLRSDEFPEGLLGLPDHERMLVEKANVLYEFYAEVAQRALKEGIPFCIENPWRSYMWSLPYMKHLLETEGVMDTIFSMCMHADEGVKRDKKARLVHNVEAMKELEARCDGSHEHGSWGLVEHEGKHVYATALERVYPYTLARKPAAALIQASEGEDQGNKRQDMKEQRKQQVGKQPRGKKAAVLVPEFKEIRTIKVGADQKDAVENWKLATQAEWTLSGVKLPKGTRKLGTTRVMGSEGSCKVRLGIPWTPQEFVGQARGKKHPFEDTTVCEDVAKAAANIARKGIKEIERERVEALRYYWDRAVDLHNKERKLKEGMPEQTRRIMANKRLLLFKEMWEDANGDDPNLFYHMAEGFDVVGDIEPSGSYPPKCNPQPIPLKVLMATGKWAQKALAGATLSSKDPEVDRKVYDSTMEDLEKG